MYQQPPMNAGTPGKRQANRVTLALNGFRISLKARLFFPHIFQPKQEPNRNPKYSCMVMWPINDPINAQAVQMLEAKLAEIKQTFHPHINEILWANPLKDFYKTQRQDGKPWSDLYRDMKWINCSNSVKFAPDIRVKNPDGTMRKATVADEMLAYDGADVLVSLSFYGLDGENNGKYGVSANFDVVILLGTGERVQVSTGVDINQAFGQFASMMGLNLQATQEQAPQGQQPMQGQAPAQAPAQQPMQGQAPAQQPAQQNYYQQPMGNPMNNMPGAPAVNGQAPYQQTNTVGQTAQGQQYANTAYPFNNNVNNGQGLV